ncbi:MAG: arsenate reductase (glutaredoxin) [Alcanivoracaceae bacterium]|nr:arsenate reductase (glutaredoxin) [Alcanivoracaceae bacterium]
MNNIKIYHNPRCSKSRKTLELIEQQGHQPEIIKYLDTPPSITEIEKILSLLNFQPRDLMRKNEAEYKENNMADVSLSDAELIALMHKYSKVIERPIVICNNKAVIGRPPESVLDII